MPQSNMCGSLGSVDNHATGASVGNRDAVQGARDAAGSLQTGSEQRISPDNCQQTLNIEIVYALPHEQTLLRIQVPVDCTVAAAIQMSGILNKYSAINPAVNKLGIFGKLVKPDTILHEQDRIEIYRPLLADPKETRRQRTQTGKATKKGRGAISA